jgi:hypothetical protein
VIFAATDSFTVVTGASSLRVESFLFTREAFECVREHLAPGGVFALTNSYWQPWLVNRHARTLEETFGGKPLARYDPGKSNHFAVLAAGPGVAALRGAPADVITDLPAVLAPEPPTDDWPFPYLREPGIPGHYLAALALVLLVGTLAVLGACRVGGTRLGGANPHFFLLGAAFLLLETKSLASFGLLFGTTWLVNACAFCAILGSVLVATAASAWTPVRRRGALYVALAASLALGWAVRPGALLLDPPWLRYALASAIAFAPVFFANLVFAHSFADTSAADTAFASNLLGAAFGGALEYASLALGYRALLPIAGALYALAYLTGRRRRQTGP